MKQSTSSAQRSQTPMPGSSILPILLLLLSCGIQDCHATLTERETLELLYDTSFGTQWFNASGWGSDSPICSWYGVECLDVELGSVTKLRDEGVTSLRLNANNVARSLPPNLYQMPHLTELHLQDNPITEANLQGLTSSTNNPTQKSQLQSINFDHCFLTHVTGLQGAAESLVQVKLSNNKLAQFPTELYALTQLERLYVNTNTDSLTGSLAAEIGQLKNLQELYAYGNRLTGSLPTQLGLLNKLQVLSLSSNWLTGPLPTELNNLVNLQVLSLHGGSQLIGNAGAAEGDADDSTGMALTGPIPSFANAPKLSKIFLSDNQLTGSLPHDFLKYNALKHEEMILINLQNNQLTGGIPVSLWNFDALHINLVNNLLTTEIADFLCTKAQWMHGLVALYDCDAILCPKGTFGGQQQSDDSACQPCPISPNVELGLPAPVYYLGATSCPGLEGANPNFENPSGGGNTDPAPPVTTAHDTTRILLEFYLALDGSRWEHNDGWEIFDALLGKFQLTNAPGSAVGSSLDKIDLPFSSVDYCSFYGIICDGQAHLEFLELANNRLHGTMPSNILTLPNLVSLDLSNNHVDVTDWTALQHATSLSRLQFSHTRVTTLEGISGGKDVLTSLFLQGIEYNQQPLPEELFELTKLHTLQLEAADLGGELSTNIAKLTQLRRLTLNENQLQGPIPPMALNNLTQLEFLDLSDNDWTGGLPGNFLEHCVAMIDLRINGARAGLGGPLPSLSTLAAVEVVELAYNSFTGPIPVDFLQASQPTDPARNDITIDLAGNGINGALPSSLALFEDPLVLKLQDNEITSVPSNLCDPNSPTASTTGLWMNGQVATLGCPAILCEPGKWNARGRASADLPCDEVCPGNLLYWGQSTCVDAAPVPNREREILDELFVATGGRYWNKTADAWLDPQKPICAREGVICGSGTDQSDGGVTELRLDRFGLRGSIPTSVYELTDLRRLAVTRNPVQLTFDGIGNAQALEVVMASYTKLSNNLTGIQDSGPVMYSFHLNDCGLSGSFPSEVLAIPSLKDLRLSGNKLTGTLPRSHWDNMVNLENLLLDGNDFNGQIPSEVGGMVSLKILDLSSNQLSGPLPVELSDELTALTELNLANQQGLTSKLNGPLLDFAKAPNLMFLDLSHNQLAGNLPTSFLENVQNGNDTIIVDLSYNQLGGPIPVEWDDLSHLLVYLEANKIDEIAPEVCANTGWMDEMGFDSTTIIAGPVCDWLLCPPGTQSSTGRDSTDGSCTDCDGGIIDAPFYGSVSCSPSGSTGGGGGNNGGGAPGDERSALMAFYDTMKGDEWVHNDNWGSNLNLCTWYGVVCRDDLSVAELRLENNGLTNANAEEPDQSDAIAALSPIEGLRLLDLKGNEINLNFASLPTTTKLEVIRISKTAVTSLAGLEKATKLTSIHAMDNALAGEFPTNILQLSEMTELYLSFNKLNGTLPEAISSLSKLEEMYIYDNELTGMLPASIAQMAELREVVLGENYFHGPIPNEFSNMGNLEQLALQSQKGKELLDGPLPDFTGAPNLWYLDVSNNDIGPTLPDDLLVGSSQKDQPVSLLLRNNDLTGSIPASLDAFKELFIDLADNRITSIPATLCDNTGWMNGAVAEVQSCDSILCPIGYYSDLGRQDTAARPCTKCDQETTGYMGQTTCRVDDSEKAILNMLFEQTGGLSWKKNDKWGTNEPICSWEGVTCAGDLQDEEGVQTINLIDNGLVGTFPSQMFGLPSLVELGLRGNEDLVVSLNGIQNAAATLEVLDVSNTLLESLAWISRATKLKSIYADQAGLIGGFPDELLSIPTLQTIHLNWNFLVGRLPIDIGVQLPGLKYLHVSGNDFHGPIPTSVGFLAELEELILDDNLISGELPSTELSYLPRLRHLSVVRIAKSGRKVTGPLPTLDKVPLLESLGLDNNDLTGTIPENFLSSSVSVQEVVMTHNSLVGGIPDALASLSQVHLAVIANEITKISQEFCDENEWIESTASFFNASCDGFMCPPGTANQFGRGVDLNNPCEPCEDDNGATFYGSTSCEVPADERAILTKIFDDLQGHGWTRNDYWGSKASVCDWYGVSCDNGAVVAINLSSNNLKGDVPSEIFHLPKLQQLLLSSNQIQISFDEIGKAANLLELRLASTGLRSLEGINSAKMLTFLSIASNNLAGQFPDGLFALENLRFLAMNNNALTGPVPEDIGELRYLRYLQLDSNLFNQNVPSFSKSLTLTHVRMAGNELTGEIPADFLRSVPARSTMQVDLSNNRLTGQVPEALGRFDKMTLALQQNQITDLPTSLCGKEDWNDGDVAIYGCDGIMCAPGTSTLDGRHTTGKPCVACPQADPDFFGQALCESVIAPASSSTSIRQWIFRISFLSYVLATAITWLA